jgi:hypothetical protein
VGAAFELAGLVPTAAASRAAIRALTSGRRSGGPVAAGGPACARPIVARVSHADLITFE